MQSPQKEKPGDSHATLMLLEPDILARMSIAEYLRLCGYTVIEALKAEDVFTVLEAGTPVDILLAEVRLEGGQDGFELAKQVREKHPAVDVILTAGVANTAGKVGKLCDDGPLEKPFHPQELIRRINLIRERRRTSIHP